jgi:hypothetical protein
MIATAMLATPTAFTTLLLIQYLSGDQTGSPAESWESLTLVPRAFLMLSGGGMVIALPAALLNALVVEQLVRFGKDHWTICSAPGTVIGLATHFVIFGALLPGPFIDAPTLGAMVSTGTAMGLLYWIMAVKPRRRVRTHNIAIPS